MCSYFNTNTPVRKPFPEDLFYLQIIVFLYCRKKIEEIGKMTALSQEEILSNTKTVVQVSAVLM